MDIAIQRGVKFVIEADGQVVEARMPPVTVAEALQRAGSVSVQPTAFLCPLTLRFGKDCA